MLWVLSALACFLIDDSPASKHLVGDDGTTDRDGDGYDERVDCDDTDRTVHPGTEETCGNGRDDNCNGTADGCDWSGELVLTGYELTTTDDHSAIGTTIAVCDANGDGISDAVIGAPGHYYGSGGVYVFYGPIYNDRDVTSADYAVMGTEKELNTGFSVDCRRDFDGDGIADIFLGAPGSMMQDGGPGTVYVVPGGGTGRTEIADEASSTWIASDANDWLGFQVVAIDVDGDDTDEFASTIALTNAGPHEFGITYLFEDAGPGQRGAAAAAAYIYGDEEGWLEGIAGNAGDLDGDGVEELAVVGFEHEFEEVFVFEAPLAGPVSIFDADVRIGGSSDLWWNEIDHADLDADGRDDLFIGNKRHENDDGAVYAFFAPLRSDTTTASADMRILGQENGGDGAGSDATSPGDVDGDGKRDLLVGAWFGGTVYLQYGGDRGVYHLEKTAQAWWQSQDAQSLAGATVAAGDVTGDGITEFLIGLPGDGEVDEGSVTIVPEFQI